MGHWQTGGDSTRMQILRVNKVVGQLCPFYLHYVFVHFLLLHEQTVCETASSMLVINSVNRCDSSDFQRNCPKLCCMKHDLVKVEWDGRKLSAIVSFCLYLQLICVCVDFQQKKGAEEIGLNRCCQWICSQWNLFQLGLVSAFSWQQARLNWGTWLEANGFRNLTRIQQVS